MEHGGREHQDRDVKGKETKVLTMPLLLAISCFLGERYTDRSHELER